MTGHLLAAAGSNEIVYTLLMMQRQFVAPSINLSTSGSSTPVKAKAAAPASPGPK
jgi:3-oxoacyl-(acyl-carrier-protein) synthase